MAWFNKCYRCPCGTECEPYDHAEIDEGSLDQGSGSSFILIIRKDSLNEAGLKHFTRQKERSDNPDG